MKVKICPNNIVWSHKVGAPVATARLAAEICFSPILHRQTHGLYLHEMIMRTGVSSNGSSNGLSMGQLFRSRSSGLLCRGGVVHGATKEDAVS